MVLLHALRHHHYEGRVAVTAHTQRDADELQAAGAHLVLRPFRDAAEEAAEILSGREPAPPG